MKTINVPLPDILVAEVENYVKSGWFTDEAELMKEDIEWALKAKTGKQMNSIVCDTGNQENANLYTDSKLTGSSLILLSDVTKMFIS